MFELSAKITCLRKESVVYEVSIALVQRLVSGIVNHHQMNFNPKVWHMFKSRVTFYHYWIIDHYSIYFPNVHLVEHSVHFVR